MKQLEFLEVVKSQLDQQFEEEKETIEAAAQSCAASIMKKRVVHVFGCGHSQMFAMELFYRAGGLVPVNALLIPHLALFPKAKLSTIQERVEGFSQEYLNLENTSADDTMIIVSISGRNAAAIDMALSAKEKGMKVIALTSVKFSSAVSSRHSSKKNLRDVADIVIDVKCVEGDACMRVEGLDVKFTGTSTILGMTVLDGITSRVVELCVEQGYKPPIYVSSNLDVGDDINKEYIREYRDLIDCL
ncbi:SIS domain-containing protein [Breznakia pachnodae]|uniref:Phosphosugar-binding protein n=1 Tax=Breznakia pachnodae TaxID=265178 RepID=A0ABU0E8Z5_9FIRM|nr:SIS domain-containing protein [Breznakia pachnodae]MDQ0363173.1 putative phosphosugar-binding protein [Breznakia pachnodae]